MTINALAAADSVIIPNCGSEVEFSWMKDARNMRCYMHEKLWIFRDAFFSPELSRKERRKALRAFVFDEPYNHIR